VRSKNWGDCVKKGGKEESSLERGFKLRLKGGEGRCGELVKRRDGGGFRFARRLREKTRKKERKKFLK